MSPKSILMVVSLVAVALLAAACGGGSDDSSSADEVATLDTETATAEAASADDADEVTDEDLAEQFEEAVLEFSACVREDGITDFPDLNADAITDFDSFFAELQAAGIDVEDPEISQIMLACQTAFGDIAQFQAPPSAEENQALEEAAIAIMGCIRDNGYPDVPDLDLSGGIDANVLLQLLPHVDVLDPEFQSVAGECVTESPVEFDGKDALSSLLQD